jgi:hypothetical protein
VFTPPFSTTFLILTGACIGSAVGALTGLFASIALRLTIQFRDVAINGILGAVGFPLGFVAALLIPWRNTLTYSAGDTLVTSTMNHYQHPNLVAYIVAVVLPILHELRCFRSSKEEVPGKPTSQSN